MKTIAGSVRVSEQLLEEIKRQHEQRDKDDRELFDALIAEYERASPVSHSQAT
jgi:hypothetical protein